MRRRTTTADVNAALRAFGLLASMTPAEKRQHGELRLRNAKDDYSAAIEAWLLDEPGSTERVQEARNRMHAAEKLLAEVGVKGAEEGTPT